MSFKISSVLVLPLAALFTGSLFQGCSIREDRNSCPCVVRLDVEEAVARAGSEVLLMVWNQAGELIRRDTLPPGTDWWSFGVERGAIRLGLFSSLSLPLNDGSIVIPRGADCPEVLLDVVSADASGELLEYHADFQKPYCNLEVEVSGLGGGFPFDLVFQGGVAGFDGDGHPSAGEFAADAAVDASGVYSISIPRQTDSSLMMEIVDDLGIARTFAIGEILSGAGYDWTQKNLEDRKIVLDYSRTRMTLGVSGYADSGTFEVVL